MVLENFGSVVNKHVFFLFFWVLLLNIGYYLFSSIISPISELIWMYSLNTN